MWPNSVLLQSEIRGLATGVRGLTLAVPKKPAGPYAQFVAEEFGKVKKQYPAMNGPAIMTKLGQDWAKVPQGKKESLLSKYEAEKVKYQKQMEMLPPEAVEKALQEKQDKKVAAVSQELKKLLKSLEKPKRPLSGYLLYVEAQRPKLPSGVSPTAAIKRFSSEWNALPVDKKAPFEAKKDLLKTEYEKAMKIWNAKMVKEGKMEQVNVLQEKLSSLKNPSEKADPLAKPKRSPSALLLFKEECLKRNTFANLTGAERREKISSKWQSMSEEKRGPYEQRSSELKAVYEKAMNRWARKMEKMGHEVKLPEKTDPLAKPKRAPSALMLFQQECKQVPACAILKGAERRQWISSKWEKMSALKRGPYELRAAEAKVEHEKAMKRWSRKMEKMGQEV